MSFKALGRRIHRWATDMAFLFWLAILATVLTCTGAWW